MGCLERAAPILPVRDLEASLPYYARLGFSTRAYSGGGYGFANLDDVESHLGTTPHTPFTPTSAYLFVDDADEIARRWHSKGAEIHMPQDTAWGQHEGVLVDPDGNCIRFGSPLGGS